MSEKVTFACPHCGNVDSFDSHSAHCRECAKHFRVNIQRNGEKCELIFEGEKVSVGCPHCKLAGDYYVYIVDGSAEAQCHKCRRQFNIEMRRGKFSDVKR